MTTVLLTLGRLPKALDLARGFAKAGCRVLVADPYGWTLAGASRHVTREFKVPAPITGKAAYLSALNEIVAREKVDLVVPVSEETMHVAHLAGMLPEGVGLFTMPPDAVLALHDKASFVRKAATMGLAVPESAPLGSPEAEALARCGPVVVKPVFSCSGNGLSILHGGEPLPLADPARPAVVQRFVEGREHSTCTIAQGGRVVATMVYRGALMSGSVAVAFERVEVPAIDAWIARFVGETGWSGFISFDFIVDAAGVPYAIECNPRATSGVHFWEPEDIARAVLDPGWSSPVRVRPEQRLQQFYACLTETQGAMLRRKGFVPALKSLVTTRDVSWDWRDPWPFLSMIGTSWPIIWQAITKGARFGEVATADVGWYDG
ncbi:ATP-grasp domain-containing protein [Novosphingobium sp.]|uniref:ATP-grasp domain-containing protein n=1 Tax=Novosphingobium sp. TaxID=1874826 RepID=UPI001DA01910|nr:ATP-grasp domain-containing protein [Novosphingobium sp.]MBX9663213.1 ATP-grasp domain-containing protein [Novosphingobium sp.]